MYKNIKKELFLLWGVIYFGSLKLVFPQLSLFLNGVQACIMLLGFIFVIVSFFDEPVRFNGLIVLVFLFFLTYIGVAMRSPNCVGRNTNIKSSLVNLFFIFIIFILSQKVDIQEYLYTNIILNFVVLLSYSLINLMNIFNHLVLHMRMEGGVTNPIWIARYCGDMIISLVLYYYYYKENGLINIKFIIFCLALTGSVLLSMGSKGPIVAIVLAMAFFVLTQKKHQSMVKILLIGLFCFGVVYFSLRLINLDILDKYFRFSSMLSGQTGGRVDRYKYTIEKIISNPIKGYGVGIWGKYYFGTDVHDYPHNSILELWFEAGLIPTIVFVCIIISSVISIFKTKKYTSHIFGILMMYYFINSLFSGGIVTGNKYIFIYAVLAATPLLFIEEKDCDDLIMSEKEGLLKYE